MAKKSQTQKAIDALKKWLEERCDYCDKFVYPYSQTSLTTTQLKLVLAAAEKKGKR